MPRMHGITEMAREGHSVAEISRKIEIDKKTKLSRLFLIIGIVAVAAIPARAQQSAVSLQSMGLSVAEQPFDPVEFDLQDLSGNRHSLSSYSGKVVFLNFWVTWCGPCRSEMPAMQNLYDELNAEGLEILAVDIQEGRNQVRSFGEEYNLTFPLLLDTSGRTASRYGIRSIPTTYLIDRSGKVFAGAVGARRWDTPEMLDLFKSILKDGVDSVVAPGGAEETGNRSASGSNENSSENVVERTIETYTWGFNIETENREKRRSCQADGQRD